MSDLIRREDANEALRECVRAYPNSFYNGIEVARTAIRKLPTVDAVEQKHGRWKSVQVNPAAITFCCSECGADSVLGIENYCPNCGAKMDGGEQDG